MVHLDDPGISNILLDDIDLTDERFRISRPRRDDALARSIAAFGILVPPILLPAGIKHVIVTGHNRLEALRGLGEAKAGCRLAETVSPDALRRHVLEKAYANALGPVGKLRGLHILRMAGADDTVVNDVAAAGLGIPRDFIADDGLVAGVLDLPVPLRRFLDQRDIPFKSIKALMMLPAGARAFLSNWVDAYYLRLNIFRDVVEMILDICRRDGFPGESLGLSPVPGRESHQEESRLHEALFALRYPGYHGVMRNVEPLLEEYRRKEITLVLPPYLDGSALEARLHFDRKDSRLAITEKLSRIKPEDIRSLLDLLS